MKILVTGSTGMLGSVLAPLLEEKGHCVLRHSRRSRAEWQFDLADPNAAQEGLAAARPDVVINLVGLTDVDACETDPDAAYRANVRTVEHLTEWTRGEKSRHFVHISTDHVYDSEGPSPERRVTIRNCYALSKLAGELAARSGQSTVLRTNFFGRSRNTARPSFTDWIYAACRAGKPINVFEDVLFSPLSMKTLSHWIEFASRERPQGVFNLGSRHGLSKADFAFAFVEAMRLPADLLSRCTSGAANLKAIRPKDMRMDSTEFERLTGMRLPSLEDEIRSVRSEYRNES